MRNIVPLYAPTAISSSARGKGSFAVIHDICEAWMEITDIQNMNPNILHGMVAKFSPWYKCLLKTKTNYIMSNSTPQTSTIIKSGYLWKKGIGVLGQTYKERLFELKSTNRLDYFEVSIDGSKTLRGTILLSASTKLKQRVDVSSNHHKFIIQTKDRLWYLWCRHPQKAKEEADEWCSLIKNMINGSNPQTSSNTITHTQPMEHKDTDIAPNPEELSLNDIIITNPINPNQPINPFYGQISASSEEVTAPNQYYASLKPKTQTDTDPISIASAPPLDEDDSKMNTQFESMNLRNPDDIQFKISETVSLKCSAFGTWVSYEAQHGYLTAVSASPMINERFDVQCIDTIHDLYTIQTPSGFYISADVHGQLKFVPKIYGIYEQWIIRYHHINKISITSKYYGTHFGMDSNGLFDHKCADISSECALFEVSPPMILSSNQRNKAIHKHWNQPQIPNTLAPSLNNAIQWPPLVNGSSIALCCGSRGDGTYVGVENKQSKSLRTNYSTYQSFDGELLERSTFYVTQNAPHQLFALRCALNDKYLSPSDTANGKIRFVNSCTEKEYFDIVWHEFNVVSLVCWHGTVVRVKNNVLYHEGYDVMRSNECVFEIKCKQRMNRRQNVDSIPRLQLPVRSIDGEIKRDIWLKGHSPHIGYLAFRSQPYRYEAVSQIMGRWETLRFKHDMQCSKANKCIVSLFSANGMIVTCDDKQAQIAIVRQEDVKDKEGARWRIYFHSYSLISIQNEKYKGWMALQKDQKTNIYVLHMLNPLFDQRSKPLVDIKHARQYKNIYCQFELCPIANCKDIQKSNNASSSHSFATTQNKSNITFSM
eukprot:986824_1